MPQPLPDTHDTATGFEMALNFGYSALIGGPKTDGSSGMLSPQLVFGARILWPLSFGMQLNGGWDTSVARANVVAAANPGLYVRGHIQHYKKAWVSTPGPASACSRSRCNSRCSRPKRSTRPWSTSTRSTRAPRPTTRAAWPASTTCTRFRASTSRSSSARAFYITEGFGIDLTMALTLWLPQQACLHDGQDRLCFDSKLDSQTTFFIGGGLVFLP